MRPYSLVLFKNKQFCIILLQRFSWRRWIETFSVPLWFLTWSMQHPCPSVPSAQFPLLVLPGAPVGNLELGALSPREPPGFCTHHQHIPLFLPSERLPSFFCFLSYEVLGIIFSWNLVENAALRKHWLWLLYPSFSKSFLFFSFSFFLLKSLIGYFSAHQDDISFPKSTRGDRGAAELASCLSCPVSETGREASIPASAQLWDLGRNRLLSRSCSQWNWSTQSGRGLLSPGRCREGWAVC